MTNNTKNQPNLFEQVLTDSKGVEEKLLGPTYPYYKNIKLPNQIGMSDQGSLSALAKDIDGLIQYVQVLVTGNSRASATGRPLGNKFFLKTGAKCKDTKTNQEVDRYIYVNNVPVGNIPFISQGLGVNFKEFKGLIPGTMSNLNVLNPYAIMSSFLTGSTPDCQEISMEVIDTNNNRTSETHYVTVNDIKNMDPCIFKNLTNPLTGQKCKETFDSGMILDNSELSLPKDPVAQLYFAGLAGVGLYVLYRCMEKAR